MRDILSQMTHAGVSFHNLGYSMFGEQYGTMSVMAIRYVTWLTGEVYLHWKVPIQGTKR